MMPYQVYQLYQAERTKTAAEIRRADEQLGELSRAMSSAWHHAARLAGEHGPVRRPQRSQRLALRRKASADYLAGYHPCFPSGRPSVSCDRSGQDSA
jgi:hypothetical protein